MSRNYESVWDTTSDSLKSKKNTILTVTEQEVLAISIDENGFEIDDQGFNFNNVSTTTLDSTYSFILNGKHILCIGKHIYQYNITKKMWSKLSQQMSHTRVGAACISITDKVIIFGGSENDQVSNAIDVICDDFSISRTFSKLPIPLKFHTVTKISDSEFILCGGENLHSRPVNNVYYGRVRPNTLTFRPENWEIDWAILKSLNSARSKHCAFYNKNKLIVIGGITNVDQTNQSHKEKITLNPWGPTSGSPLKRRIVEGNIETLKLKQTTCATRAIAFTRNCNQEDYLPFILEAKKYAILEENGKVKWNRTKVKGWKDAKELPFSVIRGSVVASPDEKYAIIVPGISKASSQSHKNLNSKTEVYLLNVKTLKIKVVERQKTEEEVLSDANVLDSYDGWNIFDSRIWDTNDCESEDDNDNGLPCLNCHLIQQGSAISYADNRCPQCGHDTRDLILGDIS